MKQLGHNYVYEGAFGRQTMPVKNNVAHSSKKSLICDLQFVNKTLCYRQHVRSIMIGDRNASMIPKKQLTKNFTT